MGRQDINIGAVANDGTGDPLRTAFDKTNDNFIEIYDIHGWGYYQDAETTPATQTFTTSAAVLQIDGGGSSSESGYLPREIRGISELWDTTNDLITPIAIGDSYTVRVDLELTAKTGSPTLLDFQLDIGGGATPTITVVDRIVGLTKTPPYTVSIGFPIFCLATFKANGGQIFLSTDTGTVTIAERGILLSRLSSGTV